MASRWVTAPAPVAVLVAGAGVAGALAGGFTDLDVYRFAGQAVLDQESLAGARGATGLPFTYPPFAAVTMVPLALTTPAVAAAAWTAASVAALAFVVRLALGELGRPRAGWVVALVTVGVLALEPVWQNLTFGQVNLLLMAAVLADVLRPERRWSGLMLGVAIGVKLTPFVFVALLVLGGHRSAAVRALGAFAATVLLGGLAVPGSWDYWGDRLLDASRVGPPSLAHNQSAYGVLTRFLDGEPPFLVWLVAAAGLLTVALLAAARWWRRGDRLLGTCIASLGMLLASPVAWSHHWVWVVPLVLTLWAKARWPAAGVAVVCVARPFVWLPYGDGRELAWSPIEHLVGNAYVLAGVGVLAWALHAAGDADVDAVGHAASPTTTAEPGMTVGGQSQESSHGR